MKKVFTNRYILLYAAAVVIIVAVLLSLASQLLRPRQQANIQNETMAYILQAAKIPVTTSVEESYNTAITDELTVDENGKILTSCRPSQAPANAQRAFAINLKKELENIAAHRPAQLPVFVSRTPNKTIYVIPLAGKGLWGSIWGYLALAEDGNTVVGAVFNHKSETPGLGAEITSTTFQHQFEGKKIFGEDRTLTSIQVKKGGVSPSDADFTHAVDAITGATITSRGVQQMLQSTLKVYEPFLKQLHKQE
ncbi:MAG: NADH:ubiquinone reductase (Na(+)-transporting) subunit C [Bacteroidales bacterium]|nr:NADH:ubiquinone reductase (Na(+)-transporting) subunit C [Bacteroidales bacterium]